MSAYYRTYAMGKVGERHAIQFFQRIGWVVEDLSEDILYQKQDTDIRVCSPNGRAYTIEVKNDGKIEKTGNVLVELWMNRKTGDCPGWYYTCKADYLCYINSVTGAAYFLDWPAVKELVRAKAGVHKSFYNWRDACRGQAQLLPVEGILRPAGAIMGEAQIVLPQDLAEFHTFAA